MTKKLLYEIERFLERRGIGPHRFGILAANNGRLVERLRNGGRVWPETEEMVWKYLAEQAATPLKAPAKKITTDHQISALLP